MIPNDQFWSRIIKILHTILYFRICSTEYQKPDYSRSNRSISFCDGSPLKVNGNKQTQEVNNLLDITKYLNRGQDSNQFVFGLNEYLFWSLLNKATSFYNFDWSIFGSVLSFAQLAKIFWIFIVENKNFCKEFVCLLYNTKTTKLPNSQVQFFFWKVNTFSVYFSGLCVF